MDNIKNFLECPSYENSIKLLNFLYTNKFYSIVIFISKFLLIKFKDNVTILIYLSCAYFSIKDYKLSFECYDKILENQNIEYDFYIKILNQQSISVKHIVNNYTYYDIEKIKKIKKNNVFPLVTFTITTCKRYELFEKTINSFINCCIDIDKIDSWFCVDDNSNEQDRKNMREKYPFFEFYFKNSLEKGHVKSMNLIFEKIKTPYIFHMEDDWTFFSKKEYITKCLNVLEENKEYSQCLINKNYSETCEDLNLLGGIQSTTTYGDRYIIHENLADDLFFKKYGNGRNCSYWPHFSLRPSMLKTKNVKDVGRFNEVLNFELEFAKRYSNKGNISCFLDGVYCIHSGRLTSERFEKDKKNAYVLNEEKQF
jgi:hypothetical protein